MIVTARWAEARARHPLLAGLGEVHHGIATCPEGANALAQPGLELGGRAVVGKREARLRRLEPCELGTKHFEAGFDQPLGLGEWHLRLVHMTVTVWHHLVEVDRKSTRLNSSH